MAITAVQVPSKPEIFFNAAARVWWPKFDKNPAANLAKIKSGLPALEHTIALCDNKRTVFQAGGHVGFWPMRLAKSFQHVFTFEPEPASFRALTKNTYTTRNITAFHSALGSITGYARMRPTMTAGTWRVANEETIDPERTEHIRQVGPWALDKDGKVEVVMTTIDDANPIHCDAIVLDVEGHEVEVLKGAAKTIAKHHPIIHVEELPRSAEDIRWHMQSLNYRLAREHGADRIYEYKGGRQ